MTDLAEHLDHAQRQMKRAVRKAHPVLEPWARWGFAARAIVYLIIGTLSGLAAIGARGGKTMGVRGALEWLVDQRIGWAILLALACGMAGYGIWQISRAALDPEKRGTTWKGLGKRTAYVWSGIMQFGLVALALSLVIGWKRAQGAGTDDVNIRDWTAYAMSYPLGQWMVIGIGAWIFSYGVHQISCAIRCKLDDQLMLSKMDPSMREPARWISQFGIGARGVVFVIAGIFLATAGYRHDVNEAHGLGGSLGMLARQPYGWIVLGVVALGMIAYGAYALILAGYRKIRTV